MIKSLKEKGYLVEYPNRRENYSKESLQKENFHRRIAVDYMPERNVLAVYFVNFMEKGLSTVTCQARAIAPAARKTTSLGEGCLCPA